MRPLLFILHITAAASLSRGRGALIFEALDGSKKGSSSGGLQLESAARRFSASLAAARTALGAGARAATVEGESSALDVGDKLVLGGHVFESTQPSLFMRYMPSAELVMCGCAKCGTTSMYSYIYEQIFGHRWKYIGPPYVQELRSKRWNGLFEYVNSYRKQMQLMNAPSTFSFALIRDPRERLVSAWKSKLSCDSQKFGVDRQDRERMVPRLFLLAGEDPEDRRCLSLTGFLTLYSKIQRLGRAKFLDGHFLPQDLGCFYRFPPETWSKVATINASKALTELSRKYLGGSGSVVNEEHASRPRKNYSIPDEALTLLNLVTMDEYAVLSQYLETEDAPTT